MRFIHAADIHLDSPLAGLAARAGDRASTLVGATRRAFDRLIDLAVEQQVAFMLIAGDLYDGDWRDFSTGLFFAAGMTRLERAGIRVAIARGNHDALNRMTRSLSLPANVHTFRSGRAETLVWEDLGVAVHGRSFGDRHEQENFVPTYPAPCPGLLNIGVLHSSVSGRPPHAVYAPCSEGELKAKGYDYWALGHVHAREVLHDDPWIVFPGNLQGRDINEPGPKGCTQVTTEGRRIVSVDPVELDEVRWLRLNIDVSACPDRTAVGEAVHAGLAGALVAAGERTLAVRLTLTGRCPVHRRLIGDADRTTADCMMEALRVGDAVWLERVEIATQDPDPIDPGRADALSELMGTVEAVQAAPADRERLRGEIQSALDRLPAEIRKEAGLEELSDDALKALLADAQAILLDRLLGHEEAGA